MKSIMTLALAAMPCALFATTVVYTNAYTDTAQWGHEGNWTNSAGEVVALAPTNGEDIAFGPLESVDAEWTRRWGSANADIWPKVTISTGLATSLAAFVYPAVNPVVGTIGGEDTERYTIRHTEYGPANKSSQPPARTMTIGDASGFLGFWTTQSPKATFKFPQGGGMSALSTTARPFVNVPTANTKVTVDKLYGSGAVNKTGDGTLAVNSFGGGEVKVFVEAGTLELTGEGETTLSDLLARAALHLDASDDSTLVKTNTDAYGVQDGYTHVTRWYDVRRNGMYADKSSYYSPSSDTTVRIPNWPYISTATSDTGLPLVDFGRSRVNTTDTTSPSNCCMQLSKKLAGREFFAVLSLPGGAGGASIAGDSGGRHPFMCISNMSYPQRLLSHQYSCPGVWNGDLAVNGVKRLWSNVYVGTDDFKDVFVISCASLVSFNVDLLGTDDYHKERTGNVRFGEILVYTNILTHTERAMVNAYLNRRWRKDGSGGNLSAAVMKNSTKISVPEGRTAKVGDVALLDTSSSGNPISDKTLRKEGDGTLVIGRLHPTDAKISVSGGSVEFEAHEAVETSAPAGDPMLWFDPCKSSSLETTDDGGVAKVDVWHDCRSECASSRKATAQGGTKASVLTNACNGLDAVDFGPDGSKGYLRFSDDTCRYAKAVFMVAKFTSNNAPWIGGSSTDFLHAQNQILNINYAQQYTPGAMWTVDGTPTDPWTQTVTSYHTVREGYHVLGFNCSENADVLNMASDRTNGGGGVILGEVLYYDRELTPAERRQTEAYLMKKWLNKDHPANTVQTVASMTVAAGEPIRLGTDGQLTIASISGGDGSLEKDGSGDVVVNAAVPLSGDVAVNGGSLTIPGEFDWNAAALYRFDASDLSTLVTNDTVNGVTHVVSWSDPRGNGKTANACIDASLSPAYPTLQTVETRTGVTRTVVDFGAFSESGGTIDPTSAAMRMNCTNGIRTAFCIFADAHDSKRATIFSKVSTSEGIARGSDGSLCAASGQSSPKSSSVARNSWYFLDGGTVNEGRNKVPSAGYHLVCVNLRDDSWTAEKVSAFANQDMIHAGGICIGEQVAFGRQLTSTERNFVSAVLMKKWFGSGTPAWTTTVRSLSLADGASLDMTGSHANLVITNFAGSGGVGVASAKVVDSLSFEWRAEDDHDSVAFSGSLTIADGATVSVSLADGAKFVPGRPYTLVSAGELDVDVPTLVLETDVPQKYSPGLRRVGDSLVLTSLKQGFNLIVW
ncbi:MAG: hypothetical protein IJG84_03185 [Kiritimatiellae bacterium]|nr:hypothetical protein [Kiritimatiellia bacterium]